LGGGSAGGVPGVVHYTPCDVACRLSGVTGGLRGLARGVTGCLRRSLARGVRRLLLRLLLLRMLLRVLLMRIMLLRVLLICRVWVMRSGSGVCIPGGL